MAESKPSKTARKREHQALQKLGERLIELTDQETEALPVNDALRDALQMARRIKSHGALRRQKQLIGKLMRQNDAKAIRSVLDAANRRKVADKKLFACCERWRDRIVAEKASGVHAFCTETECDGTRLLELVVALETANTDRARTTLRREIFRAINDVLVAQRTGDKIKQ